MDSNPVALKEAQAAMKQAAKEQGGTSPEGSGQDPHKNCGMPQYSGHDSAKSSGGK